MCGSHGHTEVGIVAINQNISSYTKIVKQIIYVHSQTQQWIFFALSANSFGHHGHHQANIVQFFFKCGYI